MKPAAQNSWLLTAQHQGKLWRWQDAHTHPCIAMGHDTHEQGDRHADFCSRFWSCHVTNLFSQFVHLNVTSDKSSVITSTAQYTLSHFDLVTIIHIDGREEQLTPLCHLLQASTPVVVFSETQRHLAAMRIHLVCPLGWNP